LTAAIIAAIICLGFIGIRLMTTAIYQSNSCEWANIDNIELHTLADIPAITDSRCRVDTVSNTKYATFQIDLKKVELDKYIVNNNLIKIGDAEAKKRELVALHNLQAESVTADLYERHGQY